MVEQREEEQEAVRSVFSSRSGGVCMAVALRGMRHTLGHEGLDGVRAKRLSSDDVGNKALVGWVTRQYDHAV